MHGTTVKKEYLDNL